MTDSLVLIESRFLSHQSFSQDSLIFAPRISLDSINQTDENGLKQGGWILKIPFRDNYQDKV